MKTSHIAVFACAMIVAGLGLAAPKKDSSKVYDRNDLVDAQPIKGRNGRPVDRMTRQECGAMGGEVGRVTPGTCSSEAACIVFRGTVIGMACITQ